MSTTPPADMAPAIPPRFRTVAYFTGLAVGGLTILATGITGAVAPEAVGTVLAVCGAVTSAVSFVLGGLGVAFRPTVGAARVIDGEVLKIGPDTWGDGTPVTEAATPAELYADPVPEVR